MGCRVVAYDPGPKGCFAGKIATACIDRGNRKTPLHLRELVFFVHAPFFWKKEMRYVILYSIDYHRFVFFWMPHCDPIDFDYGVSGGFVVGCYPT